MPLLKNGKTVDNVWAAIEDGHELSPGGCFTVSLGRFLSEHDQLVARNRSIGVRLAPGDDPGLLAPYLDKLHLIEVQFPKYTDGRAFSQAQLLRRRFSYAGEIRATGQVLRDQLLRMHRCGIDAVVTEEPDAERVWQESLSELSETYQASTDRADTIFQKRHRAAGPKS